MKRSVGFVATTLILRLLLAPTGGCQPFSSAGAANDDPNTPPPSNVPPPDAMGSDGGALSSDATFDPLKESGSSDDASSTCNASGGRVFGVRALDITPSSVGPHSVCAPDNALALDGQVTGLDRTSTSKPHPLGPDTVVSCVGVELAKPTVLRAIVARVSRSGSACGDSECTSCDQTTKFMFVAGRDIQGLFYIDHKDVPASLSDVTVDVGSSPIGVIGVCREGWGEEKDDVVVDVIAGLCP